MPFSRPIQATWAILVTAVLAAALLPAALASADSHPFDIELVSRDSENGDQQFESDSWTPAVSGDGNEVAFVVGTEGQGEVMLRDRDTGTTEWISTLDGEALGGLSRGPRMSADGNRVTFVQDIPDVETNLWLRDRATEQTTPLPGSESYTSFPVPPDISSDGQRAAFVRDDDGEEELVVADLPTDESVETLPFNPCSSCQLTSLAIDGVGDRVVVSIVDTGEVPSSSLQVFEVETGEVLHDIFLTGGQVVHGASISADGLTVAYVIDGPETSSLHLESVGDEMTDPLEPPADRGEADQVDGPTSLSADGQLLAFTMPTQTVCPAPNPDPGTQECDPMNVWVHDRDEQSFELVSQTVDGEPAGTGGEDVDATHPAISDDGTTVAFDSDENQLTSDDNTQTRDVFVATRVVEQPTDEPTDEPTEEPVSVSLGDVEIDEEDDGQTEVLVTATLDPGQVDYEITVDVEVSEGSTSEGRDYNQPASFAQISGGTIKIPPGQDAASLAISVLGDEIPEPDETMFVEIVSVDPPTVQVDQGDATVTIVDDDSPPSTTSIPGTLYEDTCLVDPRGPGMVKAEEGLSNADIALGMFECVEPPASRTVLMGRDDDYADSLSSGFLQGDSPMVLVPKDGPIPAEVRRRLTDLDASQVIIVGGEDAVGPEVEQELLDMGLTVDRRFGDTRLETAVDIAATDASTATTAIIARAYPGADSTDPTQGFADSIAAGGMAAELGFPVLLTETDRLSASTEEFLTTSGITDLLIMGGTAAVSDAVEAQLQALVPGTIERVAGDNRFGTAVAAAVKRGATSASDVAQLIMVEGQAENAWAAGFVSAYASAQQDAPIILLNGEDVPVDTAAFLTPNSPEFAVTTTPDPGEQLLTCAAIDQACFAARAMLGLSGTTVTFDPPSLDPAIAGQEVEVTYDPALPDGTTVSADGSCLKDPVPGALDLLVREDLPPLPCTLSLTIRYPDGVVQTTTAAYVD